MAVAQRVRLAAARAADGVVVRAGRVGDRHHRVALARPQHRSRRRGRCCAARRSCRARSSARRCRRRCTPGSRRPGCRRGRRCAACGPPRTTRAHGGACLDDLVVHDGVASSSRPPASTYWSVLLVGARPARGWSRRRSGSGGGSARQAVSRRSCPVVGPVVEWVRRVGQQHDHVELGPQLDVRTGPGRAVEARALRRRHPHALEQVDAGGRSRRVEPVLRRGDDEQLARRRASGRGRAPCP